jgi:hypothetical protein
MVLKDGKVWEKAGCNLSVVYGSMPQEALQAATERGVDRAKGLKPGKEGGREGGRGGGREGGKGQWDSDLAEEEYKRGLGIFTYSWHAVAAYPVMATLLWCMCLGEKKNLLFFFFPCFLPMRWDAGLIRGRHHPPLPPRTGERVPFFACGLSSVMHPRVSVWGENGRGGGADPKEEREGEEIEEDLDRSARGGGP